MGMVTGSFTNGTMAPQHPSTARREGRRSVSADESPGRRRLEVRPLRLVAAPRDRHVERRARLVGPPGADQQLGPDRGQPVASGSSSSSPSSRAEPGRRARAPRPPPPRGSAGRPASRYASRARRRARRSAPSRCRPRSAAVACSAAISAWRQVRRASPARSASASGASRPRRLGDLVAVPPAPVLVGQQHQPAVRVDPGVAARVLQQHQREQRVEHAARPGSRSRTTRTSRIASPATSARSRSRPEPGA